MRRCDASVLTERRRREGSPALAEVSAAGNGPAPGLRKHPRQGAGRTGPAVFAETLAAGSPSEGIRAAGEDDSDARVVPSLDLRVMSSLRSRRERSRNHLASEAPIAASD